ncbi:MAG: hypothetical protein ACYDEN_07210 [Acidimicrobiales bacterium]
MTVRLPGPARAPEGSYMPCRCVADLRVLEVVDAGVWSVRLPMPLSTFRH